MKPSPFKSLAGSLAFSFLLVVAAAGFARQLTNDPASLRADRALLQAFAKPDKTALSDLLDGEFVWIDANGKSLTRAQVLETPPRPANSDVEPQERMYGSTAVIRASRGQLHVLRIWVKREAGWRAVLYQEVQQVEKPETRPFRFSRKRNPKRTPSPPGKA